MSAPLALIKSWLELILPSTVPVIYDGDPEPTAPRPNVDASTFTYAAINFTADESPLSTVVEEMTDTAGTVDPAKYVLERADIRRGELDVAIYGPGAYDYCRALDLSRGRPDVQLLFDTAGDYAINTPSAVNDEPILRSATREPTASIQFTIEWIETDDHEIEAVETISTTVDVDPEES
jgi:hypothetical protein